MNLQITINSIEKVKKKLVLFEVERFSGFMGVDNTVIYDSFNYVNWYHNIKEYELRFTTSHSKYMYKSITDLIMNENREDIHIETDGKQANYIIEAVVGSIPFVERYIGKNIKAINIPERLRNIRYTGRYVDRIHREELNKLAKLHGELFIKDLDFCKKFNARIFKYGQITDELPDNLFISEVIDIDAEFRAFIYKGKILDCRQYMGDYKCRFDIKLLEEMVEVWDDKPRAFTLDIGVTSEGKTVVIEAHNFSCCGLYGFEAAEKIAYMTLAAFKEEIKLG